MTTSGERRSTHPFNMYEAIHDQPRVIAELLDRDKDAVISAAGMLKESYRIHLVGIGTSWHASLVAEYMFKTFGQRIDACAWNAFEFCTKTPPLSTEDIVIVFTHRGFKLYPIQALDIAKASPCKVIVITSTESKVDLTKIDQVIYTSYPDPSSAFTVSHTAAMTIACMLVTHLTGNSMLVNALHQLPAAVAKSLESDEQIKSLAQNYRDSTWFCFAGWGPNSATAYEVALKINEAAYSVTTGFQLEQFLHGPFVAMTTGCFLSLIIPGEAGRARSIEIAKAAKTVGAVVIALSGGSDSNLTEVVDDVIELPVVPEILEPIVYLVPLQLFTYWLAVSLKRNPDVFRLDDPKRQAARKLYTL